MAVFVLVHGGGHGGWCYDRLAPLLRAAGHEVYAPTLTGLGERAHLLSPDVCLETHIADIAELLTSEDLRDVFLVGHSYGGAVITGAADRARARTGRLVYLDAAMPWNGESVLDISPGLKGFADADMRVVDGVRLVLWPGAIAKAIYGLDDEDWDWAAPQLTPHPFRTFEDKLVLLNEAAVAVIPRAIINCTVSLKLRLPHIRLRHEDAEHVWEFDAPHDLMISHPRAVAEALLSLAGPVAA